MPRARPIVNVRSSEAHPQVANALRERLDRWDVLGEAEQDTLVDTAVNRMMRHGYWQVPADRLVAGLDDLIADDVCNMYLDGAGVGEVLGVDRKTALSYRLPPTEVTVGEWRGWHTSTIIRWNHDRPRMTTGVDVTIRDALKRDVERYEATHGEKVSMARWLRLREQAIARRH